MNGIGYGGFGMSDPGEVQVLHDLMRRQKLRKAISAGYNDPNAAAINASGNPLVPQSLEKTLASATFKADDCVIWKRIHKAPVMSTVSEFTRIEEHGADGADPWFAEGGKPLPSLSRYTRDFTQIKYLGVEGATTFAAMHSAIIGENASAEAEEVQRKTLYLLGLLESNIYFGDSRLTPLAWDGLQTVCEKLVAGGPQIVHDLRGQMLTGKIMREDMAFQRDLNAKPDLVVMANSARMILGNLGEGTIRRPLQPGQSGAGQRIGMTAEAVMADHGLVPFESTIFLKPKGKANTGAIEPKGPGTGPAFPTAGGPPAVPFNANPAASGAPAAGSLWAADDEGLYHYQFVAVGDNGASAPVASPAAVQTVAGESVTATINDSANDPTTGGVRYYRVFRTRPGQAATEALYMRSIPAAASGVKTVFTDLNHDLPDTTWAFSLMQSPDVIEVVRMLDMYKQPLALLDTTQRFLVILFAAFRSRTPTKLWAWKNCATKEL